MCPPQNIVDTMITEPSINQPFGSADRLQNTREKMGSKVAEIILRKTIVWPRCEVARKHGDSGDT